MSFAMEWSDMEWDSMDWDDVDGDDIPVLAWEDLPEPSAEDLTVLERIRERRRKIKAQVPVDPHEAIVLRYLAEVLDGMEESVCLHGHAASGIADGWQTVETLETFRRNGGPPTDRAPEVHDPDERRPEGWDRT